MLRFAVTPGHEVVAELTRHLEAAGIREAGLVLIGAVDSATISTMQPYDAHQDVLTTYHEPLELSGTGEVVAGTLHVHVVLGRHGDVAVSGHLHEATVTTFFVHAYVTAVT